MDLVYTIEHLLDWVEDSKDTKYSRNWGTTWYFNISDGKQQIELNGPAQFLSFVFDLGLRNKSLMLTEFSLEDLSYDPNVQMSGYYDIRLDIVVVDRSCPDQILKLGEVLEKII